MVNLSPLLPFAMMRENAGVNMVERRTITSKNAATWSLTQVSVRLTQIIESRSSIPRGLPFFCVCVNETLLCVKFSKIVWDLCDTQTLNFVLGTLQYHTLSMSDYDDTLSTS
jgi:hypothetical protein